LDEVIDSTSNFGMLLPADLELVNAIVACLRTALVDLEFGGGVRDTISQVAVSINGLPNHLKIQPFFG
jgi:hypothetical protein